MTARSRHRHPDQQDRLHTPDPHTPRARPLHSSPTARRLRARIPRPRQTPQDDFDTPNEALTVPSAPYAVEHVQNAYRPPPPRWPGHLPRHKQPRHYRAPDWPTRPTARIVPSDWPERDPDDTVALPSASTPAEPGERDTADRPHSPGGVGEENHPWLDPDDEQALKERRPPSGYQEYDPVRPRPWAERLTNMWGPGATLSRRAVVALFVVGAVAVSVALFVLRDRPETVRAPEMVPQSAPADGSEESSGAGNAENGAPEVEAAQADPEEDLVVHVGGEVEEAGLYTLPPGSRVSDAVEAAGGALPEADLDLLNLARPLVDGEQILVGLPQPEGGPGPSGEESTVSLNQADQAELETLPGIGEKKATAILAHREALGGSFTSVEDLLDVKGIGPSTFEELEPLVTL